MKRLFIRQYGRALGPMVYRAFTPFLLGLVFALAIVFAIISGSSGKPRQVLLTVVYYPTPGAMMPKVKMYRVDSEFCELQAKKIYNDYYALRTQAFCIGN